MVNSDGIRRPAVMLLNDKMIQNVIQEAKKILEVVGIKLHDNEGLALLGSAGARIDREKQQVFIPASLVEKCLKSVPPTIKLYDRYGNQQVVFGEDNFYFLPTSSNVKVWDSDKKQLQDPTVRDLIAFNRLVDALENLPILPTNYYPVDIPSEINSLYRSFLCLKSSPKPIFASLIPTPRENTDTLIKLAVAVRGSDEALEKKPLILCPVPTLSPLTWLEDNYYMLTEYARKKIPIQICMAPAMGVNAPVTILGAVTQQMAEFFSGVVITQLVNPGAPVIAGNYMEFFDMRLGTTCMGALENYMGDMACAEIAKSLNIPSLVFMGCSDAKRPDFQAGLETGIGLVLGALSGADLIQSVGGSADLRVTSLEKLVIDNEICGMAYRLMQGITQRGERLAEDLFSQGVFKGDHFLNSPNTMKWFKHEARYPGRSINRESIATWQDTGCTTAEQRAREEVKRILATHDPEPLDPEINKKLIDIMTIYAKQNGVDKLPMPSS